MLGIATNLAHRHRRAEVRGYRAYQRLGTPTHLDPQPNDDLGAELAAVLASLRPRQRDALLLYALADLSYDEIAEAMGVPVGTVRSLLSRARARAADGLRAWRTEPDSDIDQVKEPDRG